MKQTLAITVWQDRISPLFDASRSVLLVHVNGQQEVHRETVRLEAETPSTRADALAALGADVLICGAISRPYAQAVQSKGIDLVPFIAGDPNSIITAFLTNRLRQASHTMPGCGQHRRRRNRGRGRPW